jgi:capsule polysaccharide modification protein KpsS
MSVFNDEDKTQFAKTLEQMSETKDAYEVGEFVRNFITQRSVGTQYFFGDLRVSDYGRIFKDFALKEDVSALVFSAQEEIIEKKPVQEELTFDDAERFIIKLWSLI